MMYRYAYEHYDSEQVDPARNVNPSLLMDRERVLLREERNATRLRERVLAEAARLNGRVPQ